MSDTNFIDQQTVILAEWLNDVNSAVYRPTGDRSLAVILQDIVNVKDFGAIGDGVTDDTAAIQRAFNAVSYTAYQGNLAASYQMGGGVVRFPPGNFLITQTILIGANTTVECVGPTGNTTPTINTGTIITCQFANPYQWAFSSATYETATGNYAAPNVLYSGSQFDAGAITYCLGIKIRGMFLQGAGIYGGIRLIAAGDFVLEDCFVDNCAVPFLLNTCYGGHYHNLHARYDIYGMVISQCNAFEGGNTYMDHVYSNWTIDNTTRLISMNDLGPSNTASMPDWSQKRMGQYMYGCYGFSKPGTQTSEHGDVAVAMVQCHGFTANFYCEANTESNFGAVNCQGQISGFMNGTTNGTKYHFGVNNNIDMVACSAGTVYIGNPQNTIRISATEASTGGDWSWSDSITFVDLKAFTVSAAGVSTAVFGATTFGEALRRIGAGSTLPIIINDGDTVHLDQQIALDSKKVKIRQSGTGTRPTIAIDSIGGGFINRIVVSGHIIWDELGVNYSFPTASPQGASTDNSLFLLITNTNCIIDFVHHSGNILLNNGYGLAHLGVNASLVWRSAFADAGITATTAVPLISLESGAAALILNIVAGTTISSTIKALGTNGWSGTVLSSNFP